MEAGLDIKDIKALLSASGTRSAALAERSVSSCAVLGENNRKYWYLPIVVVYIHTVETPPTHPWHSISVLLEQNQAPRVPTGSLY